MLTVVFFSFLESSMDSKGRNGKHWYFHLGMSYDGIAAVDAESQSIAQLNASLITHINTTFRTWPLYVYIFASSSSFAIWSHKHFQLCQSMCAIFFRMSSFFKRRPMAKSHIKQYLENTNCQHLIGKIESLFFGLHNVYILSKKP